ncbi:MAG: hypothetical protein WD850_00770, partial [Candidatus Spechtbacterales bacterium]
PDRSVGATRPPIATLKVLRVGLRNTGAIIPCFYPQINYIIRIRRFEMPKLTPEQQQRVDEWFREGSANRTYFESIQGAFEVRYPTMTAVLIIRQQVVAVSRNELTLRAISRHLLNATVLPMNQGRVLVVTAA